MVSTRAASAADKSKNSQTQSTAQKPKTTRSRTRAASAASESSMKSNNSTPSASDNATSTKASKKRTRDDAQLDTEPLPSKARKTSKQPAPRVNNPRTRAASKAKTTSRNATPASTASDAPSVTRSVSKESADVPQELQIESRPSTSSSSTSTSSKQLSETSNTVSKPEPKTKKGNSGAGRGNSRASSRASSKASSVVPTRTSSRVASRNASRASSQASDRQQSVESNATKTSKKSTRSTRSTKESTAKIAKKPTPKKKAATRKVAKKPRVSIVPELDEESEDVDAAYTSASNAPSPAEQVVDTPEDVVATPEDVVSIPEEVVDTAEEVVDAAEEVADSPAEIVDTPEEVVDTPEDVGTPEDDVDAAEDVAHTAGEVVDTPEEVVDTVEQIVDTIEEVAGPIEEVFDPIEPSVELLPESPAAIEDDVEAPIAEEIIKSESVSECDPNDIQVVDVLPAARPDSESHNTSNDSQVATPRGGGYFKRLVGAVGRTLQKPLRYFRVAAAPDLSPITEEGSSVRASAKRQNKQRYIGAPIEFVSVLTPIETPPLAPLAEEGEETHVVLEENPYARMAREQRERAEAIQVAKAKAALQEVDQTDPRLKVRPQRPWETEEAVKARAEAKAINREQLRQRRAEQLKAQGEALRALARARDGREATFQVGSKRTIDTASEEQVVVDDGSYVHPEKRVRFSSSMNESMPSEGDEDQEDPVPTTTPRRRQRRNLHSRDDYSAINPGQISPKAFGREHGVWIGPRVVKEFSNTICVPDDSDAESSFAETSLIGTPTAPTDVPATTPSESNGSPMDICTPTSPQRTPEGAKAASEAVSGSPSYAVPDYYSSDEESELEEIDLEDTRPAYEKYFSTEWSGRILLFRSTAGPRPSSQASDVEINNYIVKGLFNLKERKELGSKSMDEWFEQVKRYTRLENMEIAEKNARQAASERRPADFSGSNSKFSADASFAHVPLPRPADHHPFAQPKSDHYQSTFTPAESNESTPVKPYYGMSPPTEKSGTYPTPPSRPVFAAPASAKAAASPLKPTASNSSNGFAVPQAPSASSNNFSKSTFAAPAPVAEKSASTSAATPATPHIKHASLPATAPMPPPSTPLLDTLAKQRAILEKHKPKTPSGLRAASAVSPSPTSATSKASTNYQGLESTSVEQFTPTPAPSTSTAANAKLGVDLSMIDPQLLAADQTAVLNSANIFNSNNAYSTTATPGLSTQGSTSASGQPVAAFTPSVQKPNIFSTTPAPAAKAQASTPSSQGTSTKSANVAKGSSQVSVLDAVYGDDMHVQKPLADLLDECTRRLPDVGEYTVDGKPFEWPVQLKDSTPRSTATASRAELKESMLDFMAEFKRLHGRSIEERYGVEIDV